MYFKKMKFPSLDKYSLSDYFEEYKKMNYDGFNSIDVRVFEEIIELLSITIQQKRKIFTCGNGGSSSIAEHFVCDFVKGTSENTNIKPKLLSLSSNMPLISAIANDYSYEDIFSYQLESYGDKDDVLIAISSSGESENIIKVLQKAKEMKIKTIGLVGFDGGKVKNLSDFTLHAKVSNYGIVEDLHHSLMHIMSQFLRFKNLSNSNPSKIKF